MQQTYSMRTGTMLSVLLAFITALSVIAWGIFSQPFFSKGVTVGVFGMHVFAFSSGILLLFSPGIMSFVLAMIPLASGRRAGRAMVLSFAFSVGIILTLVAFGLFAGLLGSLGYTTSVLSAHAIWGIGMVVVGGIAYVLALGEVDLVSIVRHVGGGRISRLLTRYDGAFGAFILGMFVSSLNIHPATLLLYADAVFRGDPLHGVSLLLLHACGQVIPVLFIVVMAAARIDVTDWMNIRKERARMLLGWFLLFIAGIFINVGVAQVLQELGWTGGLMRFLDERWLLALVWLVPFWVFYFIETRRVYGGPFREWKNIAHMIDRAEKERRMLEHALHFPESRNGQQIAVLERRIDVLEKKRKILEIGIRHGIEDGLRSNVAQRLEERLLLMRFAFTLTLSLFIVSVLVTFNY